jgi:hypothetical protein
VAGEPAFDEAVTGHNTALRHRPDAVVCVADADDVAATLRFARRRQLTVQAQSTGHGPPGITHGGLLIRTGALDAIDVDPQRRLAHVGAGVTWGRLVAACGAHGLAPLGMASVASVGVAGYLLGGGMGPLGRRDGFGADHVVALDVIDADGNARTVDADHDADLFWALRGGRFAPAVVTAFTLELDDAPLLVAASATYERPDVPAGLAAYAQWQADLPEAISSVATMFRFPDLPVLPEALRGRRFLQVDVLAADDEAAGRAAFERLCAAAPPATRVVSVTDPAGWVKAQPPVPPGPTWNRGGLLDRFDEDVAARLVGAVGPDTEAPWNIVEIRPFGGAFARPPAQDNAVGGRSAGVLLSVVAGTPAGSDGLPAAHGELVAALGDRLGPGVNVNFHGMDDPQHPISGAWPVATSARLRAILNHHDPTGVFPRPATGW